MRLSYSVWNIIWDIRDIPTNFYLHRKSKEPQVYHPQKSDENPDVVGEVVSLIPPPAFNEKKPIKKSETELPELTDAWF
jgi:hypothetical protein